MEWFHRLVDKGTNPDLFTVNRFEDCIRANQVRVQKTPAVLSPVGRQVNAGM